MVSSGGDNAEDKSAGDAAHVVGDEGKSHHSKDDSSQGEYSQDDSVEYIKTIRKGMRKILPHPRGKTPTPFLGFGTR